MKRTAMSISMLVVVACGGKKPAPEPPKEPEPAAAPVAEEPPAAAPAPAAPQPAPEPPAPPAPKTWHAHAQLNPVKGAKIKGALVTFAQQEGQPVAVGSTGWFDGIKPGKYHLVVHESADCGPNATKAGKAGADIPFVATAGMDSLDVGEVPPIAIDGDGSIVGHTLVLHDDKKGKPGKALACGTIAASSP